VEAITPSGLKRAMSARVGASMCSTRCRRPVVPLARAGALVGVEGHADRLVPDRVQEDLEAFAVVERDRAVQVVARPVELARASAG
jgi:hypothetical protein